MTFTIGPGEATSIVLAIIAGCLFVVNSQSKTREALLRVELAVKGVPKLADRVANLELWQASKDPYRARRMTPLTRASEEEHDEPEES